MLLRSLPPPICRSKSRTSDHFPHGYPCETHTALPLPCAHLCQGKQDKSLPDHFPQRYFLCDHYWRPADDGSNGPIFFYFGNEADVEL